MVSIKPIYGKFGDGLPLLKQLWYLKANHFAIQLQAKRNNGGRVFHKNMDH